MSQVRRRQFLFALGAGGLSVSLPVLAQQGQRVRRIGFFGGASAENQASSISAFKQGMGKLRWTEGRDYVIDASFAAGKTDAMAAAAAKLVTSRPDVIISTAETAIRALAQATATIPIVFGYASDPVRSGFAASLRRPGGNITGMASVATDLQVKRLELIREISPRASHLMVLYNTKLATEVQVLEEFAPRLKFRLSGMELREAADIERAFKRGAQLGVHAYIVTSSVVANNERKAIADGILHSKLPAVVPFVEIVEAGALISYAASRAENFRRTAEYVDKILKGAKPGELPIELPTRFELVVNKRSAKAMGIAIPQSVLLRADRVIE